MQSTFFVQHNKRASMNPVKSNPTPKAKGNQMNSALSPPVTGTTLAPPPHSLKAAPPNPLMVEKGQVSFDAEGNDRAESIHFTRVIHWPEKDDSSVTIGRGYDMGRKSKSKIIADLTAAGISLDKAKMIAEASGKKGEDAGEFVRDNRDKIGRISHEQQKALFEHVYAGKAKAAKGRATRFGAYGQKETDKPYIMTPEAYDALHPVIKELLTDLTFRGDYKSTQFGAYSKINPILKSGQSDKDKMQALKAHLQDYYYSLPPKHYMRVRTKARIELLDKGMAGETAHFGAGPPETEAVPTSLNQPRSYLVQKDETISEIAAKFEVEASSLKSGNKVYSVPNAKGKQVEYFLAGQEITIPQPSASQAQQSLAKPLEGETKEPLFDQRIKQSRIPKGRLIGASVGLGGTNHPEDVERVMLRLFAMRIVNFREMNTRNAKSIGQYVSRYQGRIFNNYRDGLIDAGGKTEGHLLKMNAGTLKAIPLENKDFLQEDSQGNTLLINYDTLAGQLQTALTGGLFGKGKDFQSALLAYQAAKPTMTELGHLRAVYQSKFGLDMAIDVREAYKKSGGGTGLNWAWEILGLNTEERENLLSEAQPDEELKKLKGKVSPSENKDSKYLSLAEYAIEATANERDKRPYRQEFPKKNSGKGADCIWYVQEVVACAQNPELRRTKAKRGWLNYEELNRDNTILSPERIANPKYGSGTQQAAVMMEKDGYFKREISDIQVGDVLFFGHEKAYSFETIGHIGICTEIGKDDKGPFHRISDASCRGASSKNSVWSGGKRTVGNSLKMRNGLIWPSSPRYYQGHGRIEKGNK